MPRKSTSPIRVSFILPTRGRPDFVSSALQRASKYTSPLDEFIVVDGSNDDKTHKVVQKYKKIVTKYFRVPYETTEAYKMNIGILNSTGRMIKPVSDDDILYPTGLKKAIEALEKNESLDALQCGGEGYRLNEKTNKEEFLFYSKLSSKVNSQDDYISLITQVPCHLGLIFKRRIIPQIGLYDSSFLACDIYILTKMAQAKVNLRYLDVCLYKHIQYGHSSEKAIEITERDRARAALLLPNFNYAFSRKNSSLAMAVGANTSFKGIGYVWLMKHLHYLNYSKPGRLVLRTVGSMVKLTEDKRPFHIDSTQKKPTKWSGRFW